MSNKLWLVGCLALVASVGCGGKKDDPLSFLTNHAVGTYIGGGSMLFGSSDCTYAGAPGVFKGDDVDGGKPADAAAQGPRFVSGPGTITKECKGETSSVAAVMPTGAKISGPTKVKAGSKSESFSAHLTANGKELGGEAYVDWQLGPDCNGIAEFDAVLGSQDTGGKDRTRTLVTKGKGKCTVKLGLTTGSALYDKTFKAASFQTEQLVTIE